MNISTHNHTDTTTTRRPFLATVRDELRQRRLARREYRDLARELASYTSRSDINDLMAVLDREAGPEADRIRQILNQNLQARHSGLLAS